MPYLLSVAPDRPDTLVELPWQWSLDDAAYFAYPGVIRNPSEVLEIWKGEFDVAQREGGLYILTMHPHVIGHRARIDMLNRLVAHMKVQPGVWFATHEQIARHVREQAGMK